MRLACAIFVMNLVCAIARSSGEVNVATIFWTHPLSTNFCQILLCTSQNALSEIDASDVSICSLDVADNPFIFWYIALMLFCCLLCLLNLSPHATRVLGVGVAVGVAVGVGVAVKLKLELIVA